MKTFTEILIMVGFIVSVRQLAGAGETVEAVQSGVLTIMFTMFLLFNPIK